MDRRKILQLGAVTTLSALAPVGFAQSSNDRYGILGQQAPKVSASYWIDAEGQPTTFDMSELDDKWVYLKCFQSWCPGCHKHGFPALKIVADAFLNEPRVAVLSVQTVFEGFSTNTQSKVREIQRQYDLPIKMGHDTGSPGGDHRPATMRAYRTGGTPWVVIVNPEGQVVYNDYHIDANKFVAYLSDQLAKA